MKTKKLSREDIIKWATGRGWELDRYGHLQREISGRQYRLKLGKNSVRSEVITDSGQWIGLSSGYYKDLFINSEEKLSGLARL